MGDLAATLDIDTRYGKGPGFFTGFVTPVVEHGYAELANYTSCLFTCPFQARDSLIYLDHRFLDPNTGMFLSVDPLKSVTDQSYAYATDDPVNIFDPSGNGPFTNTPNPIVQKVGKIACVMIMVFCSGSQGFGGPEDQGAADTLPGSEIGQVATEEGTKPTSGCG